MINKIKKSTIILIISVSLIIRAYTKQKIFNCDRIGRKRGLSYGRI